jgi:hypothetical protein
VSVAREGGARPRQFVQLDASRLKETVSRAGHPPSPVHITSHACVCCESRPPLRIDLAIINRDYLRNGLRVNEEVNNWSACERACGASRLTWPTAQRKPGRRSFETDCLGREEKLCRNYSVKFNGRLSIDAETEEEAREIFWANMREVFDESDITNVTIAEEPNV